MKLEEYLTNVTEQIRCVKARDMVSSELKAHVLDQAEAYEADGIPKEEALKKAVQDMGDPVETGISLDRVHRPQISVEVLTLIGVISILSILLQGFLMGSSEELSASGYGYLKDAAMYNVFGYIAMLIVYRLDYSILARYGKTAAALLLAFLILGKYMGGGIWINQVLYYIWIHPFNIRVSVQALLYLYVPLYAAVLYSYRGEGYKAIGKIFLWSVIPILYAWRLPALHLVMTLGISFTVIFAVAVWKNWYQVKRKRVLAVLGAGMLAAPLSAPLLMYTRVLADYQIARLQAFLIRDGDYNYITNRLRELLGSSHLIGRNGEAVSSLTQQLPGFNCDYILVSLMSSYGILAGVLVLVLLALLIKTIFRISIRQKNQLGMLVGISCGILFLTQLAVNLAVNMCLIPVMKTTLPFFSSGGSSTVVSYILLGLVLGIYRYKNILPENFDSSFPIIGMVSRKRRSSSV